MDALLMMFSRDLKRLSFDCMIPYNENDLLLIANPFLAFRLTNMVDDNGNYFSIKSIVTENDKVFACPNFNQRCLKFAEIMEARIERYFVTKRVDYLFFDDEEQNFLKMLIRKNTLTATVIIYRRPDTRSQFKEVDYTDLPRKEYLEISRYLRRLRVMTLIKPEAYYNLYASTKRDTKERFEKMRKSKDKDFMQKMYKKYPKLKNVETKTQFKTYYRGLSKKYHPDVNANNSDVFAEICTDFELIKETQWYHTLMDDTNEEAANEQSATKEFNMLTQFSEESR